jgi:DNA polymerase-3 subunit beta
MIFIAELKPLLAAINAAGAVVAGRTVIPVLECFLVEAADNALRITATNMDTFITATCPAAVATPGRAAIPADHLKRFCAAATPGALVSAELGAARVALSAGRSRCTIAWLPAEEYPMLTDAAAPHEVTGGAAALAWCAGAAPADDARGYLNGLFFSADAAVATNGARLAACPAASAVDAIVPHAALSIIGPIIATGGRLFLGANTWRAEGDGVTARGKLVDGSFPDWRRAMPQGLVEMCTVDAAALSTALQQATLGGSAANCTLAFGADGITLTGKGWRVGEPVAQAECAADMAATGALMVSTKYLAGLLKDTGDAVLRVSISGDGNIYQFDPLGRDAHVGVIFGMRDHDNVAPAPLVTS